MSEPHVCECDDCETALFAHRCKYELDLREALGTIEALEGEVEHHARRANAAMADFLRVKGDLDAYQPHVYRVQRITRRWVLTERTARWLVRAIPEREYQIVSYSRRRLGYSVSIEDHHPAAA